MSLCRALAAGLMVLVLMPGLPAGAALYQQEPAIGRGSGLGVQARTGDRPDSSIDRDLHDLRSDKVFEHPFVMSVLEQILEGPRRLRSVNVLLDDRTGWHGPARSDPYQRGEDRRGTDG